MRDLTPTGFPMPIDLNAVRVFRARQFFLNMAAVEMESDPETVLNDLGVDGAVAHVADCFQSWQAEGESRMIVALMADALAQEEPILRGKLQSGSGNAGERIAERLLKKTVLAPQLAKVLWKIVLVMSVGAVAGFTMVLPLLF